LSDIFEEVRLAASVFENSPEAIMITDAEGRILRTNRAFAEITGYSPEEVLGRNPRLLRSGRHGPEFYAAMWRSLELTGAWRGEIWNRRRSGETYPEWLSITSVKDADGRVIQYVGTFSDLTERKRIEEDRARLALHDPLTGLVNRAFFEESLRLAIVRALDTDHALALVLVDLDRFGRMNASLGYRAGDVVLAAVADRVRARVGDRGVVGRWYGDQFAVALPLPEGPDDERTGSAVAALVEEMRAALAPAVRAEGHSVHVHACFGVALCPRDARDAASLVFSAETALGRAKAMGPDAFCFHTPAMDAEVREHLRLEEEIREAIEGRTIRLHYQPLVDVDSGKQNWEIDWAFRVGDLVKIRLLNDMDQDHPMHHPFHIHGAGRFLILARDDVVEPNLAWKDTVLVRSGETVDILLDVTNPGLWMAHCHIAEHNQAGMMFSFPVRES